MPSLNNFLFEFAFELIGSGIQGRFDDRPEVSFPVVADTGVATMWVLLPYDRPHTAIDLVVFDRDTPRIVKSVDPTYQFRMADGSMFGWIVVAPPAGSVYECRWTWDE